MSSEEHGTVGTEVGTNNVGQRDGTANLVSKAVSLRKMGLSLRKIEEATGIPRTTLNRLLKDVPKGEVPFEVDNPLEEDMGQVGQVGQRNFNPIPNNPSPGMLAVSPELWNALEKIDKKNIEGWKANVLEWNRIQQQQTMRNNGHGVTTPRYYGEGELDHEMAQMVKQRRFERIMGDGDSPELKKRLDNIERKLESDKEWSRAFEILKFVRESSPTQKSIPEIIAEVSAVQGALKEIGPTGSKWSPEQVIQVEDARHRRSLEQEKAKADGKKWEYIYKTIKPLVDKTLPLVDDSVGLGRRKLRGVGTGNANVTVPVENTTFLCPKCLGQGKQVPIDVSGLPDVAECPQCHSSFPRSDMSEAEAKEQERILEAKSPHHRLLEEQRQQGVRKK